MYKIGRMSAIVARRSQCSLAEQPHCLCANKQVPVTIPYSYQYK